MLFKLSAPDMLNTSLIDVATGERAYNIVTVLSAEPEETCSPLTPPGLTPVHSASSSFSAASFLKKSAPPPKLEDPTRRRSTITDCKGSVIASISWTGRRPDITIGDEKVGALTDLFGSTTVRFMPKILAIPTRFDTEYVWTATPESLTLFDYDTETIRGSFHQNTIRIPSKGYKLKSKLSSPSTAVLSMSPISRCEEAVECDTKYSFIPMHLPGVGSCYLEFQSHPLAQDIEIILSFFMMEILRRGRFSLTPYTFEKPRLWQLKEARDQLFRRLRRNTV